MEMQSSQVAGAHWAVGWAQGLCPVVSWESCPSYGLELLEGENPQY